MFFNKEPTTEFDINNFCSIYLRYLKDGLCPEKHSIVDENRTGAMWNGDIIHIWSAKKHTKLSVAVFEPVRNHSSESRICGLNPSGILTPVVYFILIYRIPVDIGYRNE